MMTTIRSSLMALLGALAATVANPAAAAEVVVDPAVIAVLPPAGDLGEDFLATLADSLDEVARERGYAPVAREAVRSAAPVDPAVAPTDEGAAQIAGGLGAGSALALTAFEREDGVRLEVRVIGADGAVVESGGRTASRASAQAQARALTRSVLPPAAASGSRTVEAPPAAAPVVVPEPTAPEVHDEPEPVARPAGFDAAVAAAPPPIVYQTPAPATVAYGHHRAPDPPAAGAEEPLPEGAVIAGPPSEIGRVVAVGGSTAGIQAGGYALFVLFALMAWVEDEDSFMAQEQNVALLYAAIVPPVSSVLGWSIGKRSRSYDVSYPPIMLGTYLGSGASLGLWYLARESDSDGLKFWAYGLLPALLPGAGAAVAYAIARKPERGARRVGRRPGTIELGRDVAWTPPGPVVLSPADGSRRLVLAVSLGRLYF